MSDALSFGDQTVMASFFVRATLSQYDLSILGLEDHDD
jgi:hypothetical protein